MAACLAFVSMLWYLLQMTSPPTPMWYVETNVAIPRELEAVHVVDQWAASRR